MTKEEMQSRIETLDKTRRERTLVCTRNSEGGWNHSSMSGMGVVDLYIYRFEDNGEMVKHPWYGKKWKYRTYEELQLIKHLLDKIGLMVGSLKVYEKKI